VSAYSFNPPPQWPPFPQGWRPPEGWTPDPAWGPAPEGWEFWVLTTPAAPSAAPDAAAPSAAPGALAATAAPKKGKAGMIIGIGAAAVVLVGSTLFAPKLASMLTSEDGLSGAWTVEQAQSMLDDDIDEFLDYVESIEHGVDGRDILVASVEETRQRGHAATTIDEVEFERSNVEWWYRSIEMQLDEWNARYTLHEENLENATGSVQEAFMDEISDGLVTISFDSECRSTACVTHGEPTVVHIRADYRDRTDLIWEDIMWHEYAHVIQKKYDGRMMIGLDYAGLFNSDNELHADCMAEAKKPDFQSPYGSECSPEMLELASNFWEGIVE
jgi:hypothetical protein